MNSLLNRLFGFREPVDRRFFFLVGISLMIGKYIVDAIAIYTVTGIFWTPLDYLVPLIETRADKINAFPLWFSIALVVWTLPFIWIGVSMTFRRAINAGKSPWYVLGFFVPILNYLLMLWLSILPTNIKQSLREEKKSELAGDRFRSALYGVVISLAIGIIAITLTVFVIESYGLSIFALVPFILGLVSTYVFNASHKHGFGESVLVAFTSLFLLGGALILFALEGVICVALAIPFAVPIVLLGAILGHAIARRSSFSWLGGLSCLILFPVFWGAETISQEPPTFEITTTMEITAPPAEVWRHVVVFEDIEQQPAWYFQLGIAYPTRARIQGNGVGAIRYCEFSTGAFVEPITVWEKPHRLAFDVQKQPASLQELSFYQNVHAPHIYDFFRSTRGEFRLVPIGEGNTRLEGTTWYELEIYPHFYWRPISEWLVHKIHRRVLSQIAKEAERGAL